MKSVDAIVGGIVEGPLLGVKRSGTSTRSGAGGQKSGGGNRKIATPNELAFFWCCYFRTTISFSVIDSSPTVS